MPTLEAPRIFPTLRYNDAASMIDWLGKAFGFAIHARYMDGAKVGHVELALGSSMIMIGSVRPDDYGRIVGDPGQNGGKAIYLAVEEVDAVHARAKAVGADIVQQLTVRDYGSREFICRNPEGNVWSVGTDWPKAGEPGA